MRAAITSFAFALTLAACGPAPYAVDASEVDDAPPAPARSRAEEAPAPVVVAMPAPPPRPVAVPACADVPVAPCYIVKNPPAPPPPPVAILAPAAPPPVPFIATPAPGIHPVVAAMVRSRQGQIQRCYERGLRRDPTLSGRVVVEMRVDGDGEVDDARDAGSTIADRRVVECVVDVFEELDFDTPVGRRVVYPVELRPGMR